MVTSLALEVLLSLTEAAADGFTHTFDYDGAPTATQPKTLLSQTTPSSSSKLRKG